MENTGIPHARDVKVVIETREEAIVAGIVPVIDNALAAALSEGKLDATPSVALGCVMLTSETENRLIKFFTARLEGLGYNVHKFRFLGTHVSTTYQVAYSLSIKTLRQLEKDGRG